MTRADDREIQRPLSSAALTAEQLVRELNATDRHFKRLTLPVTLSANAVIRFETARPTYCQLHQALMRQPGHRLRFSGCGNAIFGSNLLFGAPLPPGYALVQVEP